MGFADFIQKRIRRARIANFQTLVSEVMSGKITRGLSLKIDRYAQKYSYLGITRDQIIEDIGAGNKYIAVQFTKDPLKQNIAEKLQIEFLAMHGVSIRKAPANMYIDGPEIVFRKVSSARRKTKSVDAVSEDGTILYFMKWTMEPGGAQDNQFSDIKRTIRSARDLSEKYTVYMICDGAYYTKSKMAELRDLAKDMDRVHIKSSDDFVSKKKKYGQFYTTNAPVIFRDFEADIKRLCRGVNRIVEPFVGNGDLITYLKSIGISGITTETFDIDPRLPETVQRDTLRDPPDYRDAFVITNPPYLAQNKSDDKSLFAQYGENDLFRCFLRSLIDGGAAGGAVIVPVNFISSTGKNDVRLRRDFFDAYDIVRANAFERPVFEDTGYNVVAFSFRKSQEAGSRFPIFFEDGTSIEVDMSPGSGYFVLGDKIPRQRSKIVRRFMPNGDPSVVSRIRLRALDAGKNGPKIGLEIIEDPGVLANMLSGVKVSDRAFAHLVFETPISEEDEEDLVSRFNAWVSVIRRKSHGLCFSAYRESGRKRMPFDWAFAKIALLLG